MLTLKQFIAELSNPAELSNFRKNVKDVSKVDTRDTSWMSTVINGMKSYGFKLLGQGKYASVFGNDKYPFVVKVFMKDAAYLKWIEFCLKNQNNKYVPKIKGKVIKITDLFYAIRLEKLTSYYGADSNFGTQYDAYLRTGKKPTNDQELKDIFDYFDQYKSLLDLHNENLMLRGKQVVIIDPFYNWFNKTRKNNYEIDVDDFSKSVFRSVFAK